MFLYWTLLRLSDKAGGFCWVSITLVDCIVITDIVKSIVANVLQTVNTSKHRILEAKRDLILKNINKENSRIPKITACYATIQREITATAVRKK